MAELAAEAPRGKGHSQIILSVYQAFVPTVYGGLAAPELATIALNEHFVRFFPRVHPFCLGYYAAQRVSLEHWPNYWTQIANAALGGQESR